MCGRYFLKSAPSEIGEHFGADWRDNAPARYNIAPTQPVLIARGNGRLGADQALEMALVRWGFLPAWAKGEALARFTAKPLINARAETAFEKPSFRHAIKRRRCLVPANGFYEWQRAGKTKRPFMFTRLAQPLFCFGGIWETIMDESGGEVDSMAILTTDAGDDMRAIHHREPLVIAPNQYNDWLFGDERDIETVANLMHPSAGGSWRHDEVAPLVNNVRHDGPELIAPLSPTLF